MVLKFISNKAKKRIVLVIAAVFLATINVSQIPVRGVDALISSGKSVKASTQEASNAAEKAVDGDMSTRWAANGGIYPQWLMVDLGSVSTISRVDMKWYDPANRSYKYKLEVSDDGSTYTQVIDQTKRTENGDSSDKLDVLGRYVRVTVTGGKGSPCLYEFEVYGAEGTPGTDITPLTSVTPDTPAPAGSTPESSEKNIAIGRAATSGTNENGNPAENAFDGAMNTRWAAANGGMYPQWVMVDLESVCQISKVDIKWYKPEERSYQYKLEVSDDNINYKQVADQTKRTEIGNTSDKLDVSSRYVKITITGGQGSACFYEVEVYGVDPNPPSEPVTRDNSKDAVKVYLNGEQVLFDVPPTVVDGRTLVPMRRIFEAFKAKVEWDESTSTVKAVKDNLTLVLKIGDKNVFINNEKKEIDVPPMIISDRTMVPTRIIAESLGAKVSWDEQLQSVIIRTSPNTTTLEPIKTNEWTGTWATSPYLVSADNMPPSPGLVNNTIRQIVRVSIGGNKIKLKFSNQYGKSPLTMNSVHLAVSAGAGAIKADTDKVITFAGKESVIIPAGQNVTSDIIDYSLTKLTNMAITINYGGIPAELTGHPGSRTTSYIMAGNAVKDLSMASAVKAERWYTITGIDVLTQDTSRAVVALGDSITDGRGTTTDAQNRWTDILATRLQENANTSNVGVLNQGIGGNGLFGGLGPAAINRFDSDVLEQSGVRYVIVFEGVNDIGSNSASLATATQIIKTYKDFINKAHKKNMYIYGATIMPFGGSGYYSELHEQIRQRVNAWIRTSGEFDGVIDFDAGLRDPADPTKLLNIYNGDSLHPNAEGYKKMGEIIDTSLFTK